MKLPQERECKSILIEEHKFSKILKSKEQDWKKLSQNCEKRRGKSGGTKRENKGPEPQSAAAGSFQTQFIVLRKNLKSELKIRENQYL